MPGSASQQPPQQQPGTTTPSRSPQASLADSPLSPTQQQCLTPPSVRRREARIARCAVVAGARADARRAAAAAAGGGEGGAPIEDEPRVGYAAEEVEARRTGRRAAAWRGWEADAAAYEGPRVGEGDVVRPDGTVDWERFDRAADGEAGYADAVELDGPLALGRAADQRAQDVRRSLDAPAALPPRAPLVTLPSLPSALAAPQLAVDMLPLVLGAVYVAARAFGVGSRRPVTEASSGAGAKTRRWQNEHDRRE
ncbi:ATP-dependent DNA helicase [Rhodotorula diobovata]|uniref:ATP-dependent DNA helicase n=1 Tax=Rhodotorula diobovata TaxID=5288 RepID=A0A5C5FTJ1_9BASI|nr:ATP-dependent DNA helicase [Rhodotorula diobovata]